jgi:hypothetical protein
MIAHANWERPIYVATTVGQENYMNLGDNFVQEGLANRITPFTTNAPGAKSFDTEKTYDNVMKKFKFGNVSKPGIYLDETVMRMCYTHRRLMATLALNLIQEGKDEQARQVLAKCEKELPSVNVPHDFQGGSTDLVKAYVLTDQEQKAQQLLDLLWKKSTQYMTWYLSLDGMRFDGSQRECMLHLYVMNQLYDMQASIDEKKAAQKDKQLEALINQYHAKGGTFEN